MWKNNKKKIETIINRGNKTSILKLQSMAMKAIKSGDELEHDGEELDEAKNYKIKNGKIHISKANFRKVHKDYKNSTKGKERMMALDPKSGATTSFEVVFEEVDIDERILKFCNDVVDELKEDALVKSGKDKKIGPSQVFNKRIIDRIDNKIKENQDG